MPLQHTGHQPRSALPFARLPVCSAYQILIFLSSTAWGLLTMLCLWPPIWTMVPRQADSSWLTVLCAL